MRYQHPIPQKSQRVYEAIPIDALIVVDEAKKSKNTILFVPLFRSGLGSASVCASDLSDGSLRLEHTPRGAVPWYL